MKLVFINIRIASATVLLLAGLLAQQSSANSQSSLTPAQSARIARDLVPSQSQEFFRQGQEKLEREIQHLRQQQTASPESPLKVNVNPQTELERLPQVQPTPSQ